MEKLVVKLTCYCGEEHHIDWLDKADEKPIPLHCPKCGRMFEVKQTGCFLPVAAAHEAQVSTEVRKARAGEGQ